MSDKLLVSMFVVLCASNILYWTLSAWWVGGDIFKGFLDGCLWTILPALIGFIIGRAFGALSK